jgi:hypothetical protein
LLDPALWRRFDMIIDFPMPTSEQVSELVSWYVSPAEIGDDYFGVLIAVFAGHSFSDIKRELLRAKRETIVFEKDVIEVLPSISRNAIENLPLAKRKEIAVKLRTKLKLTERDVLLWTGVARDTVRSAIRANRTGD